MKALKGATFSLFFFSSIIIAKAINNAKIITGIICPSAIDFIGFVGSISLNTSIKLGISLGTKFSAPSNTIPLPTEKMFPNIIPTIPAIAVVPKSIPIALIPKDFSLLLSSKLDILLIIDTITKGITTILINEIYIFPIGSTISEFSFKVNPKISPNPNPIKVLTENETFLLLRYQSKPKANIANTIAATNSILNVI